MSCIAQRAWSSTKQPLWYEERGIDLGSEFIAEIDRCLQVIAEHPDLAPVVHGDIRRVPIKRFPYNIYYRRQGGRLLVLAIFHGKRDPTVWQRRR